MREWLEDNPRTREEFVKLTSTALNRAKGDEWEKEGLFVQAARRQQVTREEFFRQAARVQVPKKQRRKRFQFTTDKRGRRQKRDKRGRYAVLTKRERKVKSSSHSLVKKRQVVGEGA